MQRSQTIRRIMLLSLGVVLVAIGLVAVAEPKGEPSVVAAAPAVAPAPVRAREPEPPPVAEPRRERPRAHQIDWRDSVAVGEVGAGSLQQGVMLPAEGVEWVSWDPVERDKPNRWWRRWGTDRLVRTTLAVVRDFAAEHPQAPRILIGDLSRPRGGDFGTRFGPIGHATHQNGLDVDVYYPRIDRREWTPRLPSQVDVERSQELVDRFVAAGAEQIYVGPSLPLTGPAGVVVPLVNHDNHLHVRLPGDG